MIASIIGDAVSKFLFSLITLFNAIIYSCISFVYQIFLVLSQGEDILDDTVVDGLISRIYIIIGVIILFLVAYSLLKSMINPDEALKGKKSVPSIIKDIIISIVLIAITPYIFEFAFDFQNSILRNNTIGKLIVGSSDSGSNSSKTIEEGGYTIAATVWQSFFYPNEEYCLSEEEAAGKDCEVLESEDGITYTEMWDIAKDNTTFFSIVDPMTEFIVEGKVTYLFLIDIAAGIFVLIVLAGYCIDMAIRLIKLAVFQLFAPIPIFARIIPNDQANKIFSNWLKATISTFVEVFIRIAMLFFAILIINTAVTSIDNIIINSFNGSANMMVVGIAKILLVVGIFLFIKQAPQMIKDITGLDGGKYSPLTSAYRTLSSLGGGITAGVNNWNAKNPDGSQRGLLRKAGSALGGLGSGSMRSIWNRDEVKNLKDIRSNAHNSAEAAIKKRIQRENAKAEQEAYFKDLNKTRVEEGLSPVATKGFGASTKYKAHQFGEVAKEWAGKGKYDSVALSRTKEYADKVDANFSALEGTWKKTQSFIDAKAETEKLENDVKFYEQKYNEELTRLAAEHNIDLNNASADDLAAIKSLTNEVLKQKYGTDLETVIHKKDLAKNQQDNIKFKEQEKKAESIADAARNIQLMNSQYSDIVKYENIIGRFNEDYLKADTPQETKEAIKVEFEKVLNQYGDLRIEENYKKFVSDLKSSDIQNKKRASDFIDILDKINLEAMHQKGQASFAEQEKAGSFTKTGKKDGGK